jgi:TRAP transporter TAXI family solute receptor
MPQGDHRPVPFRRPYCPNVAQLPFSNAGPAGLHGERSSVCVLSVSVQVRPRKGWRMVNLQSAARPRGLVCALAAAMCGLLVIGTVSDGWSASRKRGEARGLGVRMNANTVAIMSGYPNGTYMAIAADLATVLDDGEKLRILPIVGRGGAQNIRDTRFLKNVDLGITQSNLLKVFDRSNEIGPIKNKVLYVTRLFNEEMHLIVRTDSGINSINELDGKKVNFSNIGSGTQRSARDIFERLDIKPVEVNTSQGDALAALKQGEIAATILIAGKPTGATSKLKAADGFRILPVPFAKPLQSDYLPTTLTHDDYPNLIKVGRTVDTIAVGAVLIAYNWDEDTDRYRRIEMFINAFFPRLAEFQKSPRHPKWRETNLTATIPNWRRFPAAEEWLRKNRAIAEPKAVRAKFERFLTARASSLSGKGDSQRERERLFREFLQWDKAHKRR